MNPLEQMKIRPPSLNRSKAIPATGLCVQGNLTPFFMQNFGISLLCCGESRVGALGDLCHLLINSAMPLKVYACNLASICLFYARKAF